MKKQYGVDRMLQKVQQELDTNVPVLEGTDVEATGEGFFVLAWTRLEESLN